VLHLEIVVALMQWLSKALTKGPDLKADILDAGVELKGSKLPWKLHEAKRKDNGSPASVLAFEITAATSDVEIACARNALHRFKTIRHPHVLLYLDGFEPPEGSKTGKVLIVVEHVKPLEQYLAQSTAGQEKEAFVWGLWTVAQALHFVNADCKMQHGNVCVPSIFVSDSGDWKLAGFELMGIPRDPTPIHAKLYFRNHSRPNASFCDERLSRASAPPPASRATAGDAGRAGAGEAGEREGLFRRAEALRPTRVMPPEVVRGQVSAAIAAPLEHSRHARARGTKTHAALTAPTAREGSHRPPLSRESGGCSALPSRSSSGRAAARDTAPQSRTPQNRLGSMAAA
jgi:hypothetical protein